MDRALEEYQVVGLPTNIEFVRKAVKHPAFRAGGVDTGFLEVRALCCVPAPRAALNVLLWTFVHRCQRYANDVVPKPTPSPKKTVALAALAQFLTAPSFAASSGDASSPWSSRTGSRPMSGRSLKVKFTDASGAERVAEVRDATVPAAQYSVVVRCAGLQPASPQASLSCALCSTVACV